MAFAVRDLVRFTPTAECVAAIWCRARGISGVVTGINNGVIEIDVGLYYKIYAAPEHLEFIANQQEAPIPDDQII